jgi:hypothetical protein
LGLDIRARNAVLLENCTAVLLVLMYCWYRCTAVVPGRGFQEGQGAAAAAAVLDDALQQQQWQQQQQQQQ